MWTMWVYEIPSALPTSKKHTLATNEHIVLSTSSLKKDKPDNAQSWTITPLRAPGKFQGISYRPGINPAQKKAPTSRPERLNANTMAGSFPARMHSGDMNELAKGTWMLSGKILDD